MARRSTMFSTRLKASRMELAELERVCQKPDHRTVGNWLARRVARPVALRITRVVADWGVSANAMTAMAWLTGLAGAAALAWGGIVGWLAAAVLLHVWYLLDHVDGQLARWHGRASLDGKQLDYLMHHAINLAVPLGAGYGLASTLGEPAWLAVGVAWGMAAQQIGLMHDARYKTFIARLKRLEGRLEAVGGGGGRPAPPPGMPLGVLRAGAWMARKWCEVHVVLVAITVVAVLQWMIVDEGLAIARCYAAVSSGVAIIVAVGTLVRDQRRHAAEEEFAKWFRDAESSKQADADDDGRIRPRDKAA